MTEVSVFIRYKTRPYAMLLSMGIIWIFGFLSMGLFVFVGISGEKMGLIWLVLFVGLLVFSVIHYKEINKCMKEIKDKRKVE